MEPKVDEVASCHIPPSLFEFLVKCNVTLSSCFLSFKSKWFYIRCIEMTYEIEGNHKIRTFGKSRENGTFNQ